MTAIPKPRAGRLLVAATLTAYLATLTVGVGATSAAQLVVSTHHDLVANDGRCSLREAVSSVNRQEASGAAAGECPAGDGAEDTIVLGGGRYTLDREPAGEDENLGGDLDLARSVVILGEAGATKVVGGLGDPRVLGDGDTIFEIDPAASGGVSVVFRGVQVSGGDTFCQGERCQPKAGGIHAANAATLTIEDCVLQDNAASCSGELCGRWIHSPQSAGGLLYSGEGDLTVLRSKFLNNTSACQGEVCSASPAALGIGRHDTTVSAQLEEVEIRGNETVCAGLRCSSGGVANLYSLNSVFTDGSIDRNRSSCSGERCTAEDVIHASGSDLWFTNTAVSNNRTDCEGWRCRARAVMQTYGVNLFVRALLVKSNQQECAGVECYASGSLRLEPTSYDLDGIKAVANRGKCEGDGCGAGALVHIQSGYRNATLALTGLVSKKNSTSCRGTSCAASTVHSIGGTLGPFSGRDSEVFGTKTRCRGTGCYAGAAISLWGGDGSAIENFIIRNNRCDTDLRAGGTTNTGCALTAFGSDLTFTNLQVIKNRSDGGAGGIGQPANHSMALIDSLIARNHGGGDGGGIANAGTITELTRTTISDNRSKGEGAGIANSGTIVAISDSVFEGNRDRNRGDECLNMEAGVGCP